MYGAPGKDFLSSNLMNDTVNYCLWTDTMSRLKILEKNLKTWVPNNLLKKMPLNIMLMNLTEFLLMLHVQVLVHYPKSRT